MISQRYCNALELPKVLAMLAEKASCQDSVQRVLEIVPAQSFSAAKRLLTQTSDASMLMRRFGQPTILSVKNPASSLKRAKAGGLLSMRELLSLGEVLRNIRGLWEWHGRCDDTPTALDDHFSQLEPNKYLEDRISGCILSEEEMNDSASPALLDIRQKNSRCSGQSQRTTGQNSQILHLSKIPSGKHRHHSRRAICDTSKSGDAWGNQRIGS